MALLVLGSLLAIVGLIGWVIILIDAFKAGIWKGVAGLICGFYLLYYAITEYQANNKWLIIGLWLGGLILGNVLLKTSMAGMPQVAPMPR